MPDINYGLIYNQDYYTKYNRVGDPHYLSPILRANLQGVISKLIRLCHPKSYLDIGCAMNFMVEHAVSTFNIQDALGIDVSPYAYEHSVMQEKHMVLDASVPFNLGRTYDLVTCVEVAEHLMTYHHVTNLLDNIADHAQRYVFFSSTQSDYDEPTHYTILENSAWIEEFAERGFVHYSDFEPLSEIPWGLFFIHKKQL